MRKNERSKEFVISINRGEGREVNGKLDSKVGECDRELGMKCESLNGECESEDR